MRLSLEIFFAGASVVTQAGAVPRRRNGLACIGPTGVLEQGGGHEGRSGT